MKISNKVYCKNDWIYGVPTYYSSGNWYNVESKKMYFGIKLVILNMFTLKEMEVILAMFFILVINMIILNGLTLIDIFQIIF